MVVLLFLQDQGVNSLLVKLNNPSRGTIFIYIGIAILVITLRRMGRKRNR